MLVNSVYSSYCKFHHLFASLYLNIIVDNTVHLFFFSLYSQYTYREIERQLSTVKHNQFLNLKQFSLQYKLRLIGWYLNITSYNMNGFILKANIEFNSIYLYKASSFIYYYIFFLMLLYFEPVL